MDNEEAKNKKIITIVRIVAVGFIIGLVAWREYLRYEIMPPEKITTEDNLFEMQLRKGWEKTKAHELNDEADIEIKNKRHDAYLIALMEDIKEYDASFQDYVDLVASNVEESYSVKIDKINTNGSNRNFCFNFTQDGEDIYMCMYVIQTKNYVGQVAIWSLSSNKDFVDSEIKEGIIDSIKEK